MTDKQKLIILKINKNWLQSRNCIKNSNLCQSLKNKKYKKIDERLLTMIEILFGAEIELSNAEGFYTYFLRDIGKEHLENNKFTF